MNLRVQSVIFDMDGVITNTMPDHFRAWRHVLQEAGVTVSHYDVYSREGQPGLQSVREIFAAHHRPFDEVKARHLLREKEELFKSTVRQRFITGSRRFLRRLHHEGFRLALVTGTSRHEMHHILPDALYRLFAVAVTGNDVQHGKPHPEPYLTALKKLDILPKQAVVIENAPLGIRAAKAAGLRCLALETSLPRRHLAEADKVFTSFQEMTSRLHFTLDETRPTTGREG